MDINKILQDLGIDLSNPEARRGATEAIQAILQSRQPVGGMGGGFGGGEIDVEIDPDLIQPSAKQPTDGGADDVDVEINDEEKILDQVKRNESEEDSGDATNNDSGSNSSDSSSVDDTGEDEPTDDTEKDTSSVTADNNDSTEPDEQIDSAEDNSTESSDDNELDDEAAPEEDDTDPNESDDEDSDYGESEEDEGSADDEGEDLEDDEDSTGDGDSTDSNAELDDDTEDDFGEEDEDNFDEDDLVDDALKGLEAEEIKTKTNARKIKRERTLAAAKSTLEAAKARKATPALIRELEKAIEALESLTEAVKSIKDVSDEEFNLLVNRVFDAIDALGDKSLTFSSDEERQLRAKEIKADMANVETQHELSAEDAALIRDEHQATKARDKEAAKYQARGRSSFKGFQDFLNSLYRAIALQVSTEEERADSWSAISRRNSGVGVLQQGKRIQDLNNKRIPVIDFYFDQSASWDASDIKIGEKAVSALADMAEEGKIKINVYYFANHVHTDATSARNEGGTRAWNDIVKNIVSTNATNVIVMTDDDMEDWWEPQDKPPLAYTVPGYVWYLWKNGYNAPRLPRDLKGRGGVQQFSFNESDV